MRVVAIGVDGLEANLLRNFFSMAHHELDDVLDSSLYFDMLSTTPPMSPPAWSSIITGLNPENHGIYDFYMYDKLDNRLKMMSGKELKNNVFEIMNIEGKRQILINIPFLAPPMKVRGVFVSGLPSTYNSLATFPRHLRKEFDRKGLIVGEPPWSLDLSLLIKSIRDRSRICLDMMSTRDWDFTMIVFRETDIVQHFYWGNRSAIYRIYSEIEASMIRPLIEAYIDRKEDLILMIFGDHGFTTGEGVFNITNWLYSRGLYSVSDSMMDKLRIKVMSIIKKAYGYRRILPLVQIFQETFLRGWLGYLNPGTLENNVMISTGGIVDGGGLLYINPKYSDSKRNIARILRRLAEDSHAIEEVKELNVNNAIRRVSPDIVIKLREGVVCNPYFSGEDIYDDEVPPSRWGVHRERTLLSLTLISNGDIIDMYNGISMPLSMEDVGAMILFMNGIAPPPHIDGKVPDKIAFIMKKYIGRVISPVSSRTRWFIKSRRLMG